jgi:hypothetical protein
MPPASSGIGHNALSFEGDLENSHPRAGYRVDGYPFLPPVDLWRKGAALVGTNPEVVASGPSALLGYAVKWDHDEGTSSKITAMIRMDEHWAEEQNDLVLNLLARKVDAAAADENTDLKIEASFDWYNPTSGTTGTLTPIQTTAIGAALDNTGVFYLRTIDVGAALKAANKKIPRGNMLVVGLYPHENVGTTDMDLELLAAWFRGRRHPAMKNRSLRW